MRESCAALGGPPACSTFCSAAKAGTANSSRINSSFSTVAPSHQSLLPEIHDQFPMRHSYHPRLFVAPPFPHPINNLLLLRCHFDFCRCLTYASAASSRTKCPDSTGVGQVLAYCNFGPQEAACSLQLTAAHFAHSAFPLFAAHATACRFSIPRR